MLSILFYNSLIQLIYVYRGLLSGEHAMKQTSRTFQDVINYVQKQCAKVILDHPRQKMRHPLGAFI